MRMSDARAFFPAGAEPAQRAEPDHG